MGDDKPQAVSIWTWAFGYFACYAPYSALTKALSGGALGPAVPGSAILPISTLSSFVATIVFLWATGWWRSATKGSVLGFAVPRPTWWTALSGLCGTMILTTTTLAYTFEGVSIVFMMLLMRGGVLIMAPVVDAVSRRKVSWSSWTALGLCLTSLLVATGFREGITMSLLAVADVAVYLLAYFIRLRFMSHLAKSDSAEVTRRYFVEEQLVSTPAALLLLAVLGLFGVGSLGADVQRGLTELPFSGQWHWAVLIGVLSQGTGIFGALVLLDKRENTFSVPVNRASSVLAGVLATLLLVAFAGSAGLPASEVVGAALVVAAIAVLSVPPLLKRRRAAA